MHPVIRNFTQKKFHKKTEVNLNDFIQTKKLQSNTRSTKDKLSVTLNKDIIGDTKKEISMGSWDIGAPVKEDTFWEEKDSDSQSSKGELPTALITFNSRP